MEDRAEREIRFPNVEGYRVVFPRKPLKPAFTTDSHLVLTPDDIPMVTQNEPLIGEGITFDLRQDADKLRLKSVIFDVAGLLLREKFKDSGRQSWKSGATPNSSTSPSAGLSNAWNAKAISDRNSLNGVRSQSAQSRKSGALVLPSETGTTSGNDTILLPVLNAYNPEGIDAARRLHHVEDDDFRDKAGQMSSELRGL